MRSMSAQLVDLQLQYKQDDINATLEHGHDGRMAVQQPGHPQICPYFAFIILVFNDSPSSALPPEGQARTG
jgi:hypothetical protein